MADDDTVFHDEVEIEDFVYDDEIESFTYPCPCGDLFTISKEDLENGEDVAHCPSCSLVIRVIYNPDDIDNLIKSKVTNKAAVLLETN